MSEQKRCPYCAQPMPRTVDATWERHDAQRAYFGDVAVPDVPFSEYERSSPARDPSTAGDVVVPFLQTLISGAAVALLGTSVLVVTGGDVRWALIAGVAAATVIWFSLLADSRSLLRTIERVVGADVDGDGYVGEPEPKPESPPPFRVEVKQQRATGSKTSFIDLPSGVDADTMRNVARAVLAPGGTFSRPHLCDERGILSQGQYADLRSSWLRAGLVVALPGNRTDLTAAGRAVLRRFQDGENG